MTPFTGYSLAGRSALVTAAGAGIGRAAATLFAAAGARVVVSDRDLDAAEETQDLIRAADGVAIALPCDVSSVDALRELFDQVDREVGSLDVLFNNAGRTAPVGLGAAEADWDQAIDVNMKSGYFATQLALPLLRRSSHASVIFTSSASGLVAAPSACYSMAKGGIVMLAKSAAVLLAADGVRVNAICPGPIDTALLRDSIALQGSATRVTTSMVDRVPLGRLGRAEEVAAVALFLASDASSFVTGAVIPVDGGYTAQ